ncbi:MAG: LysR family transcriptional regulator [Gammaproteobacteria bacterium]|nr:LysR family transcriptional regulator [Gammaproteobacteria bacterium]
MKHNLPPLDSLKAFEASARLMSFTKAAEELCVTKGAVSYQVKRLEQHLNQTLFKRSTRQILLTDAGQRLYQSTQHWFAQIQQTFNQISQDQCLTIAVTTYTAVRWLSPYLAQYARLYPQQKIVLKHSVNHADFDLADVDLSIRWQRQSSACDHFIEAPLFPVASPKLRAQLPAPNLNPGDLSTKVWENITLLCEARDEDLWHDWNQAKTRQPRNTIEDANVRVQAAIDGQGIMLADKLMHNEIANGALEILSEYQHCKVGYAIYCHTATAQKLAQYLML